MMQTPMLSCPLKATNEIDWIAPLKQYIRTTYGDDPERYADECAALNRLRQDMRGAGKDSAAGRDLLYRYYGQLELLDLRFPVDENHIKISFTWFDAFTHKPTAQYSLAYEKASIIFNISAVLSCHAAHQDRNQETNLKVAYHSFQASAGMFTYINENFLHAPSTDLSRDTVKTLIAIMLAQGQEVFLEKQIADGKKVGLMAKLASQAAYLYTQALEGVQDNVVKAIFERVWLLVVQFKTHYMTSLAHYYQALADDDANSHGIAISRLEIAMTLAREAAKVANSFPSSIPATSNLAGDTGSILANMAKTHLSACDEKLQQFNKDNDFIYHQTTPPEAALPAIPKLPAAKPIPVSELYQGQDIHRIVGPDIFQKIVPMAVTESASMYDEEKAKLVRAESERVEIANDEMAASLDYLKLPNSLNILKGGLDQDMAVDSDFRNWCQDFVGHAPFAEAFEQLNSSKSRIHGILDQCQKSLDMEESVCEKMRNKYGAEWTQQPSSRLTSTLRSDIRNYRGAVEEASMSDVQLYSTFRQHESDMEEMRSAGETDEADVLYQRAMIKVGAARKTGVKSPAAEGNLIDDIDDDDKASVAEQIAAVEDLLKKLTLIKREREKVLKDLKEKVHNDDISSVLILNKKAMSQENQLFKTELEKFRPHQQRLLQAQHKQHSLMKELTRTYSDLLSDKRVRQEQNKYEAFSRQRSTVMTKYKKVHQALLDLQAGLERAKNFYSEMKDTVDSLYKNVEGFVGNRKAEGSQLLNQIESGKTASGAGGPDREQQRLKEMMDRMSMNPSSSPHQQQQPQPPPRPLQLQQQHSYNNYNPAASPPVTPGYGMQPTPSPYIHQQSYGQQPQHQQQPQQQSYQQHQPQPQQSQGYSYNPTSYAMPNSPPAAQQQYFSPPPNQNQSHGQYGQSHGQMGQQQNMLPHGYVPPPPPPGPPPHQQQQGYGQQPQQSYGQQQQQQGQADPWAGLGAWK
ncbi:vacuolar protein-sorting protein bro1 [Aureobasidium pullulans]|nr:vacuolar protein-sorting protein bro1 [Aureobasidium pullulans]